MRNLIRFCILVSVLLPAVASAQTNDGTTYPWCEPKINRLFAMHTEGHPLANDVTTQVVGDKKRQFENVNWPIPPFPENPQPQTLLRFRVADGSYYWWFDGQWTRIAAVADVLERSGIIYGIGRVDRVTDGVALIDLGDVHTLKTVAPFDKVAVFRLTESRYSPIGVLSIARTFATFSQTRRSLAVKPQPGDVVMFVRELSQMKSIADHRDTFLRRQLLRTSTASVSSNVRRFETAKALRDYDQHYQEWERSGGRVIGFLNGESYADGRQEVLQDLLSYLDMIREDRREGRNGLSAAGTQWGTVMEQLLGPTVTSQHEAAQAIVTDENLATGDPRPTGREIRRVVRLRFFENSAERNDLLSYLIATMTEVAPGSPDIWMRQRLRESQFPEMADDEGVLERIRLVVVELNEG